MITLDEHSSLSLQLATPFVAGIGIGMLFHTPFGILTELMPPEDLAGVTGAFFLVRFIGATIGLSIADTIFSLSLRQNLPPGYTLRDYSPEALRGLVSITDPDLRMTLLRTISKSIQHIWIFCTPCLAMGCLISFLIPSRPDKDPESEITENGSVSFSGEKTPE